MGSQFTPEAIRAELVKRYPSAFDGSDPVEESNIQLRNARDWVLAYYLSKATRTPASGPVETDDRLAVAVGALERIKSIKPEAIGDTGFQTGPLAHFQAAKRIAAEALAILTNGEAE